MSTRHRIDGVTADFDDRSDRRRSRRRDQPGKYGPYAKRGDDTASVPDDLAPDELTIAKALELLAMPKSDEPIGELDGYPMYAKRPLRPVRPGDSQGRPGKKPAKRAAKKSAAKRSTAKKRA